MIRYPCSSWIPIYDQLFDCRLSPWTWGHEWESRWIKKQQVYLHAARASLASARFTVVWLEMLWPMGLSWREWRHRRYQGMCRGRSVVAWSINHLRPGMHIPQDVGMWELATVAIIENLQNLDYCKWIHTYITYAYVCVSIYIYINIYIYSVVTLANLVNITPNSAFWGLDR